MVALYCGLSAGFAIAGFLIFRLQDGITQHFSAHEALDIAEAVLVAELMTRGFVFTLTAPRRDPTVDPLLHGLLLAGGLILARITMRIALSEGDAIDYQSRRERVILIGTNRLTTAFIRLLCAYAPNRQTVVAVLDEKGAMIGRALDGVQVLGTPQELEAIVGEFAIHGIMVDRVIIAGERDLISAAALHDVERVCKKRHIAISFLPVRMLGLTQRATVHTPAVALTQPSSDSSRRARPVLAASSVSSTWGPRSR